MKTATGHVEGQPTKPLSLSVSPPRGLTDTAYATADDMRVRFGAELLAQLAPPSPEGEESAALAAALKDASDLIDSYAQARYRVPLNPVPAPVRRWCADIARWYVDTARTDEAVRKAYEDALAGLKDMARGVIVFQVEGVPSADKPVGQIMTAGPDRMFSGASLKGY